mgnify:CR=1 FL=1
MNNFKKIKLNNRLDKSQFAGMRFKEADKAMSDYKLNAPQERLEIANRLIAIAYNFPLHSPPPIDKAFFEARNLKDGKHF